MAGDVTNYYKQKISFLHISHMFTVLETCSNKTQQQQLQVIHHIGKAFTSIFMVTKHPSINISKTHSSNYSFGSTKICPLSCFHICCYPYAACGAHTAALIWQLAVSCAAVVSEIVKCQKGFRGQCPFIQFAQRYLPVLLSFMPDSLATCKKRDQTTSQNYLKKAWSVPKCALGRLEWHLGRQSVPVTHPIAFGHKIHSVYWRHLVYWGCQFGAHCFL